MATEQDDQMAADWVEHGMQLRADSATARRAAAAAAEHGREAHSLARWAAVPRSISARSPGSTPAPARSAFPATSISS